MTPNSCVGVQGAAMTLVVVAVRVCLRVYACLYVHLMKPHLVGAFIHFRGCGFLFD